MNAQKKITLSTLKSFVRQNAANLMVQVHSDFCGMSDCVIETEDRSFRPIIISSSPDEHDLGIQGVWLVLRSRDYFRPFFDGKFSGIEVTNCCGRFTLAIPTEVTK